MFYERLQMACDIRNKALTSVVRAINCSPGLIDGWKNKGSVPRSDILAKLADYLDVNADFLLARTDNPSPIGENMRNLDNSELALVDKLRKALPPVRSAVLRMAEAALTPDQGTLFPEATGPSFLLANDEQNRPEKEEKEYGRKRVEGDAAAGVPITIVPQDDLMATVPIKYMSSRYFIVRAKGDSMIDAGIDDGDFCVFQKDAYLDEGSIVLAQVDGSTDEQDATIKRVFFHEDEIEFRSENPKYKPMYYPASEVRLMGRLVDILATNE